MRSCCYTTFIISTVITYVSGKQKARRFRIATANFWSIKNLSRKHSNRSGFTVQVIFEQQVAGQFLPRQMKWTLK